MFQLEMADVHGVSTAILRKRRGNFAQVGWFWNLGCFAIRLLCGLGKAFRRSEAVWPRFTSGNLPNQNLHRSNIKIYAWNVAYDVLFFFLSTSSCNIVVT
jgi:hypothetical protein